MRTRCSEGGGTRRRELLWVGRRRRGVDGRGTLDTLVKTVNRFRGHIRDTHRESENDIL